MSKANWYYHQESDTYIGIGTAFVLNNVQYPANWLDHASDDDLAAAALVPCTIVGGYGDERFYVNNETREGATLTRTATLRPLEQIRAFQWEAIKAERERRKLGGVKVGSKWYHTDAASRTQYIGLLRMADAAVASGGSGATTLQYVGQDIQWKTLDGSFIKMTVQRANEVFSAVSALDFIAFANAEAHKAALEASPDPASYDFSTGWPESYTQSLR